MGNDFGVGLGELETGAMINAVNYASPVLKSSGLPLGDGKLSNSFCMTSCPVDQNQVHSASMCGNSKDGETLFVGVDTSEGR